MTTPKDGSKNLISLKRRNIGKSSVQRISNIIGGNLGTMLQVCLINLKNSRLTIS